MKQEKKIIAVFDFDGTLTIKDTLFDFIAFYHGKIKLITGLIFLSPVLILYKLGLIKNSVAKRQLFSYYFKGKTISEFKKKCDEYAERIRIISNKEVMDKLHFHQEQGHIILIVSASVRNWIEPWANHNGVDLVIGTEIELNRDSITGYFSSENCYGLEKVNRFLEYFPDREGYIIYAYGDSKGDKEILELADYPTLLKK